MKATYNTKKNKMKNNWFTYERLANGFFISAGVMAIVFFIA
jgi:hypothetical protein